MNKFLIVGLGNIGIDYVMTRHNIGFEILDQISENNENILMLETEIHSTYFLIIGI